MPAAATTATSPKTTSTESRMPVVGRFKICDLYIHTSAWVAVATAMAWTNWSF